MKTILFTRTIHSITSLFHRGIAGSMICFAFLCTVSGIPGEAEAQRGLALEAPGVSNAAGEQVLLYKESHALVIGINDYTAGWPDLPGVQRDVSDVETVLKEHGFNVIVKNNLNKIEIEDAFNDFINRYGQEPDNRLLFYFAGHGHTVLMSYGEELGYIVPEDSPNPYEDLPGFQSMAIDMQRIEYYAKRIQAKHALFLFDACFSGSLFALSRAVPEIINYKTALPVRQFITSGSADETVPDESIFRAQFVRALRGEADVNQDGYVTGTELGEFIQTTVVNYSYNSQHPQYGKIRNPNLDKGDFVFTLQEPSTGAATSSAGAPADVNASFDDIEAQLEWQEYLVQMEDTFAKLLRYEALDVQNTAKIEAWQRFLETFAQDNPYVTKDEDLRREAEARILALEEGKAPQQEPASPVVSSAPAPAIPQSLKTFVEPVTGIPLVWIEGGCFQMGSPSDEVGRNSGEGPVHEVCVDGFWMGQYEVTQQQWEQLMGKNPSRFTSKKVGSDPSAYPVDSVSWKDVQTFLQKLNSRTDGPKFRLPSEAEWEYACRAGSQTAYSFGNTADALGQHAWYGDNSGRAAHAVGQLQPNAWGLYDMHGNVWEWTADPSHDNYVGAPSDGNTWTSKGNTSMRMLRGGSWGSHPIALRSANRIRNKPDYHSDSIGFRIVR